MAKSRWLLPTNTNNLRMIISQGLVTSSPGFKKYYTDVLARYNGWIPLFHDKVSSEALNDSIIEAPDVLTSCIIEVDIAKISGEIKALKETKIEKIYLENTDVIDKSVDIIFIPGPLPLNCISNVLFRNKDTFDEFKKDASTRSNVILGNLKLKTDQKLFDIEKQQQLSVDAEVSGLSVAELPACQEIDYSKIYAYGGMLALLCYQAKNGSKSNSLYKAICDGDSFTINNNFSTEIRIAYNYFVNNLDFLEEDELRKRLHEGVIDIAIDGNATDFKNKTLQFLKSNSWSTASVSHKYKNSIDEVVRMLNDVEHNLHKAKISQHFENEKSVLKKMLLMQFQRDDSESFIKYDTVTFDEIEYILYSMIFGIRDKFSKVPPWIRKYKGLQNFISAKMAEYAHQLLETGLKFQVGKPPKTVWEIVSNKLDRKTISKLTIENCIKTEMPKGIDFSLVKGRVVFPSFVEPKYIIDETIYFKEISTQTITDKIYNTLDQS
jgi:hypothetical protein